MEEINKITKKSQAKKINELLKKQKGIIKEKINTTNFKSPVMFFERRSGEIEFYENVTKGMFEFKHSDGENRFIIINTNDKKKFGFADKTFHGYFAHEDYPITGKPDPLVTTEQINIIVEKSLTDIKEWQTKATRANTELIKTIAWGVIGIIIAIVIYKMMVPQATTTPTIITTTKDTTVQLVNTTRTILPWGEKRMTTNIRLTNLNNKSRQGLYIYIKSKGQRGRYYKYKEETTIDSLKQYYEDTYIKKQKKGSLQQYIKTYEQAIRKEKTKQPNKLRKQADTYLKKIKKLPKIRNALKKGITNTYFKDALTTTNTLINNRKKDLLKNIVIDKELLNIITTTENMKKITNRLEYRIKFKDKENKTIGETNTFNKTPEQVINEIKKISIKGEEILRKQTPKLKEKLQNLKGYQEYTHKKDGTIRTVQIQMIFRKAK